MLPRGHLAMSGDILVVTIAGGCYLLALVGRGQARDAAEHPAMCRTAPNKKESSGPKCQ